MSIKDILDNYKPNVTGRERVDLCDICSGEILLAMNKHHHEFNTWDYALLAFEKRLDYDGCTAHAVFYHGAPYYHSECALHFSDKEIPEGTFVSRESKNFVCKGGRLCGIDPFGKLDLTYYRMDNHDYSVFSQLLNSVDLRYDVEKRALFDMRDDRKLSCLPVSHFDTDNFHYIEDLLGEEFHFMVDLKTLKVLVELEQLDKLNSILRRMANKNEE